MTHVPRVKQWLLEAQEKLARAPLGSKQHADLVATIADYERTLEKMGEKIEREPGSDDAESRPTSD